MRNTLMVIAATLLWCCATMMQARADTVTPILLQYSDPGQTAELTVVKIVLPLSILSQRVETFYPEQWRAIADKGNVRQLYFSAEAADDAVLLYGLWDPARTAELTIYFAENWVRFEPVFAVALDAAQAEPGHSALLAEWASARNGFFARYVVDSQADSRLLASWMDLSQRVYGADIDADLLHQRARLTNGVNLFSLLSGQAAIQETLQQQLLDGVVGSREPAPETLAELSGPEMDSHPFADWLQDSGQVFPAIAKLVPPDRFFVYSSDAGATLGWLDHIGSIGAELAGLSQVSYLHRGLIDRYLERLHLPRALLKKLGPLADQVALFGPDLYFEQGTHISLIVEAAATPVLDSLLKLMLNTEPDVSTGIHAYGEQPAAYFARHQRWLIFSTSREELATVMALAAADGEASLGASAEFRYMMSQLPPADEDGLYVYFSDPFIRAMLGPRIKIAQYRRAQARTRLHLVTDAALLYELDHAAPPSLEELLRLGYIEREWLTSWEGDRIDLEGDITRSRLYGTLAKMTPLSEVNIEAITLDERDAYRQYVEQYSQFWQEYFDPIGIRVQIGETIATETLILPLVQNSIYEILRETIGGQPVDLSLPTLTPEAMASLSLKIPRSLIGGIIAEELHRDRIGFRLLKRLGSSLHLSLYDSDPLLTLGAADLFGAFSAPWLDDISGGGFLYWGVLATLLTQPMSLFVELDQQGVALDEVALEDFVWDLVLDRDFGDSSLEKLGENGDRGWVYTLNLENLLRLHLYIRQIGNFLAISNRQLDFRSLSEASPERSGNAGILVDFTRIKAMAPSLHLHYMQRRGTAEMKNIGRLLPFMWLGAADPALAEDRFARIYGVRPEHPKGGEWLWHPLAGDLESSVFGSLWVPKVPSYFDAEERQPIGPFRQLDKAELNFRFEDSGVRIQLYLTPLPEQPFEPVNPRNR